MGNYKSGITPTQDADNVAIPPTRRVDTTAPLTGGGALTQDLNLGIDTSGFGDAYLNRTQIFIATNTFAGPTTMSGTLSAKQLVTIDGGLSKTTGNPPVDTLYLGGAVNFQVFGGQNSVVPLTGFNWRVAGSGFVEGTTQFSRLGVGDVVNFYLPAYGGSVTSANRFITSGEAYEMITDLVPGGVGTGDALRGQTNFWTGYENVFSRYVTMSGTVHFGPAAVVIGGWSISGGYIDKQGGDAVEYFTIGATLLGRSSAVFRGTPDTAGRGWELVGSGLITGPARIAAKETGDYWSSLIPFKFGIPTVAPSSKPAQQFYGAEGDGSAGYHYYLTGSGYIAGNLEFGQFYPKDEATFNTKTRFTQSVRVQADTQASGALRVYGSARDLVQIGNPGLSTHFHYFGGDDEQNIAGAGVRYQLVGSGILSGSLLARPRLGTDTARFILPVTFTQPVEFDSNVQISGSLRAYYNALFGNLAGQYIDLWRLNSDKILIASSGVWYGGDIVFGAFANDTQFQVTAATRFYNGVQASGSFRAYSNALFGDLAGQYIDLWRLNPDKILIASSGVWYGGDIVFGAFEGDTQFQVTAATRFYGGVQISGSRNVSYGKFNFLGSTNLADTQASGALRIYGTPRDLIQIGNPALSTHFHYLGGDDEQNIAGAGVRYQLVGSGIQSGSLLVRPRLGTDTARFILPVTFTQPVELDSNVNSFGDVTLSGATFRAYTATPWKVTGSGTFEGRIVFNQQFVNDLVTFSTPTLFALGNSVTIRGDLQVSGINSIYTPLWFGGQVGVGAARYIISGEMSSAVPNGAEGDIQYKSGSALAGEGALNWQTTPKILTVSGESRFYGPTLFRSGIMTISGIVPTVIYQGLVVGESATGGFRLGPLPSGVTVSTGNQVFSALGGTAFSIYSAYNSFSPARINIFQNRGGSLVMPTPSQAADTLGSFDLYGYAGGTSHRRLGVRLEGTTTENWWQDSWGSKFAIWVAASGSDGITERFNIDGTRARVLHPLTVAGNLLASGSTIQFGPLDTRGGIYSATDRYLTSGEVATATGLDAYFNKTTSNFVTGSTQVFSASTFLRISGYLLASRSDLQGFGASATGSQFGGMHMLLIGSGQVQGHLEVGPNGSPFPAHGRFITLAGVSTMFRGSVQVSGDAPLLTYVPLHHKIIDGPNRYLTSGELNPNATTAANVALRDVDNFFTGSQNVFLNLTTSGQAQFFGGVTLSGSTFRIYTASPWKVTGSGTFEGRIVFNQQFINDLVTFSTPALFALGSAVTIRGDLQASGTNSIYTPLWHGGQVGVGAARYVISGELSAGGGTGDFIKAQDNFVTGARQVFGPITNVTISGALLTASGISAYGAECIVEQTGDTFGKTKLSLRNRVGMAGALFEQAGSVDLIDFGFKTLSHQRVIRIESRAGSVFLSAPEFEFGDIGGTADPNFVMADDSAIFRRGPLYNRSVSPLNRYVTSGELNPNATTAANVALRDVDNYFTGSQNVFLKLTTSGQSQFFGGTTISGGGVRIWAQSLRITGSGIFEGRINFNQTLGSDVITFAIPAQFSNPVSIQNDLQASGQTLVYQPIWANKAQVAGNRYLTSGEIQIPAAGIGDFIKAQPNFVSGTPIVFGGRVSISGGLVVNDTTISGAIRTYGTTNDQIFLGDGTTGRYLILGKQTAGSSIHFILQGSGQFVGSTEFFALDDGDKVNFNLPVWANNNRRYMPSGETFGLASSFSKATASGINNTTNETTVWSATIPANTFPGSMIRMTGIGRFRNGTGSNVDITTIIRYGAFTLYSGVRAVATTQDTPVLWDALITGIGSARQIGRFQITNPAPANTGTGNLRVSGVGLGSAGEIGHTSIQLYGNVDASQDQTLKFILRPSTADATIMADLLALLVEKI